MESVTEIICFICKNSFYRRTSELNRSIKNNRKSYCSRKCSGIAVQDNLNTYKGDIKYLKQNWGRDFYSDEFSSFRKFARSSRNRSTIEKETTITLQDLKEQWENQKGICPLTGWKLILPKNTASKIGNIISKASLDRIDSSKGYIKGNIRFISYIANICKNNFTDIEVIEFCEAVINYNKSQRNKL